MKKFLIAVTAATTLLMANSCEKEDLREKGPGQGCAKTPDTETMVPRGTGGPCQLANITTTDYYGLSYTLAGSTGSGQGSSGVIDNKLNCNGTSPGPCHVSVQNMLYLGGFSNDISAGNHVLSDGVMSISEQQWLVSAATTVAENHRAANYPAYTINSYDVWYSTSLCGPSCISIIFFVDYKASKRCL